LLYFGERGVSFFIFTKSKMLFHSNVIYSDFKYGVCPF
jgi:hypothetical protein